MKSTILSVTGWEEAITTMFLSKKHGLRISGRKFERPWKFPQTGMGSMPS